MRKTAKHTSSFHVADKRRNQRRIDVYTVYGEAADSAGREQIPISGRLILDDGQELTRTDKGRYQAVNGEEFTSDDPNAV
jgi:hypothetical protein